MEKLKVNHSWRYKPIIDKHLERGGIINEFFQPHSLGIYYEYENHHSAKNL